mmetsp:Transcript_43955/g.89750  ORF Transcript_43955/g.89750 Transcript_43955/m.89750 type:complete len:210 (+) Transcript_43955:253-882(+)
MPPIASISSNPDTSLRANASSMLRCERNEPKWCSTTLSCSRAGLSECHRLALPGSPIAEPMRAATSSGVSPKCMSSPSNERITIDRSSSSSVRPVSCGSASCRSMAVIRPLGVRDASASSIRRSASRCARTASTASAWASSLLHWAAAARRSSARTRALSVATRAPLPQSSSCRTVPSSLSSLAHARGLSRLQAVLRSWIRSWSHPWRA